MLDIYVGVSCEYMAENMDFVVINLTRLLSLAELKCLSNFVMTQACRMDT